jgi:hypothetical protein
MELRARYATADRSDGIQLDVDPKMSETRSGLIRAADRAMYQEKALHGSDRSNAHS